MSVQAMSWVLDHSRMRLGAKLLLLAIANHAGKESRMCWAGVPTLAREAGLSVRRVEMLLPKIERSGELEIQRGKGPGGSHIYVLPKVLLPEESSGVKSFRGRNPERTPPEILCKTP